MTEKEQQAFDAMPCPFCGAGETHIKENGKMWTGMKYSDPASVSVQHWCDPVDGQPSRMIERVGRDKASAIAAWNTRAAITAAKVAAMEKQEPVGYMNAGQAYELQMKRISYVYVYPDKEAGASIAIYLAPGAAQKGSEG